MLEVDENIVKRSGPSAAITIAWLQKNFEQHDKPDWVQVFKRLEEETGIHIPFAETRG